LQHNALLAFYAQAKAQQIDSLQVALQTALEPRLMLLAVVLEQPPELNPMEIMTDTGGVQPMLYSAYSDCSVIGSALVLRTSAARDSGRRGKKSPVLKRLRSRRPLVSYGTSPLGGPLRWRIHSRETALFLLCAPSREFLSFSFCIAIDLPV
jgi:hypothetical protein